jgi:hypothetical protein
MRAGNGQSEVQGNRAVVELLDRWKIEAAKGRLQYLAIIGAEDPAHMLCEFTGVLGCEFAINYGLDAIKQRIVQTVKQREPVSPLDMGADYVCYNLNKAPMNWDHLIFLVDAEMTRRREGAPAPLKVGYHRTESVDDYRPSYSDLMLNRVMRPLLPLIGAVEDDRAVRGRLKEFYAPRYISEAARAGEAVPILRPSDRARDWATDFLRGIIPPVTITLREAEQFPWRNSDVEAWTKFAGHLKKCGEKVIFVRDTRFAEEPIDGFRNCPQASRNVDQRMALYERAKANLFVSNGPQGLAMFSDRPFLSFHQLAADDVYEANRPDWWAEHMGIKEGEQFPWFEPTQRFVYKPDTFENLVEEWEKLEEQLGASEQYPRPAKADNATQPVGLS